MTVRTVGISSTWPSGLVIHKPCEQAPWIKLTDGAESVANLKTIRVETNIYHGNDESDKIGVGICMTMVIPVRPCLNIFLAYVLTWIWRGEVPGKKLDARVHPPDILRILLEKHGRNDESHKIECPGIGMTIIFVIRPCLNIFPC